MEKILINIPGACSEILVGEKWESVSGYLPAKGVIIVTDENVRQLYGDRFPDAPVFSLSPGEESKKLATIGNLAEKLLDHGIDRSGFILAIGGGVVCDIAGFLASVYMRGIRCGYVSTTLLAQVDASTGGKNGVNLGGTKNILGIIRQPEFVICDPLMLTTLSEDEYLSGLAELIKTAIIGKESLFCTLEEKHREIMERDPSLLTDLVSECVRFKAAVVTEDENENGLRRILNFGHTFGHAIEMHESLKHGFAVADGMVLATHFSFERNLISREERDRIINLLGRYGLLGDHGIPDDKIEQLILHDKKKSGNEINFVFTEGLGKSIVKKVNVGEVIEFYKNFRDNKIQR